ncbi:MAG: non-canonical purine NTP pyrophosphatase [Patescibacteria group bacterium]
MDIDIGLSTWNPGKAEQIRALFVGTPIRILTLDDLKIEGEGIEDGSTLEENAGKKAAFAWGNTDKMWVMADDTGLFIEALGGEPGVITADWAGKEVKGEALRDFVLEKISQIPEGSRTAYWETVAVVRDPKGNAYSFTGKATGVLISEPRGPVQAGMPYSQIFIPDGSTKTWAEMSIEEENAISHRGKAFQQVREFLLKQLR